jgi:hypothetical protein
MTSKRRKVRNDFCSRGCRKAACAVHYLAVVAALFGLLFSETFTVYQARQSLQETSSQAFSAISIVKLQPNAQFGQSKSDPASIGETVTAVLARPEDIIRASSSAAMRKASSLSQVRKAEGRYDRKTKTFATSRTAAGRLNAKRRHNGKTETDGDLSLGPRGSARQRSHTEDSRRVEPQQLNSEDVLGVKLTTQHRPASGLSPSHRKMNESQGERVTHSPMQSTVNETRSSARTSSSTSGQSVLPGEERSDIPSSRFVGVSHDAATLAAANVAGNFDNLTRISYMMYRLIKTHHISSLIDIPCTNTLRWMPQVLHYLDYEVPGFRYTCVVPSEVEKDRVQKTFGDQASPIFLVAREYWRLQLPTTDVAFLWNILGFLSPQQSWALLKSVRQAQTKYVVIPNYPQLRNNPAAGTHHGRVNVRRAPYRFAEALRVFNNISTNPKVTKQMLLYDTDRLRQDDL